MANSADLVLNPLIGAFHPTVAYCLPEIYLHNDPNGNALKTLCITDNVPLRGLPFFHHRTERDSLELARAIHKHYERERITKQKEIQVERFRSLLADYLTRSLGEMEGRKVCLDVYGSSINGFGTIDCDVDMSLSFRPSPPSWVLEHSNPAEAVMKVVTDALVAYKYTLDERFISAKVPIVRFRAVDVNIEADISYSNTLALYNTSLLSHYRCWDPARLPVLGIWVKTWAKRCNIGDASRGGLSSYAWIVMVIAFMQNTGNPPFLKKLQDQSDETNKVISLEQGWNIHFSKDIDYTYKPHPSTNVFDLFVGFLRYFHSVLNTNRHVVIQIGSSNRVFKSEIPMWENHVFCVQDPFELDHNLAQGVDVAMMSYIMEAITESLTIFLDPTRRAKFLDSKGLPIERAIDDKLLEEYMDYLLYACQLRRPPPFRLFFGRTRSSTYSFSHSIDHSPKSAQF